MLTKKNISTSRQNITRKLHSFEKLPKNVGLVFSVWKLTK